MRGSIRPPCGLVMTSHSVLSIRGTARRPGTAPGRRHGVHGFGATAIPALACHPIGPLHACPRAAERRRASALPDRRSGIVRVCYIGYPMELHPFCVRREESAMSRTIRLIVLAALLPTLIVLPILARPTSAAGKITIATSAEPNSADFHQSVGTIGRQLAVNLGDALVALDENLQVQPALAESWKQESATSWVFVLRKGVKFHDGTPFNAAAVKFNFERLLDPATKARDANMLAALDTVEVIDDTTVRLKLKRPFAPLVRTLAYILGYMVSPTAAKAVSLQDFGRAPVATGPFKLARWVSGDHIMLVANKDYWRGTPKIDEITWKFVPQSATRAALLRSGDVDFVETIDGPDLASVEGDGKLVVTRIPLLSWK